MRLSVFNGEFPKRRSDEPQFGADLAYQFRNFSRQD